MRERGGRGGRMRARSILPFRDCEKACTCRALVVDVNRQMCSTVKSDAARHAACEYMGFAAQMLRLSLPSISLQIQVYV